MFAWLPLIGPIIQGIISLFTKYKDVELEKYKTDGTVDIEAMRAAPGKEADNLALRILQDIALVPPVVWSALIGWDTIVAIRYPGLMFHVENYPTSVQYIPYMAFVFLFGAVGMTIWKRK